MRYSSETLLNNIENFNTKLKFDLKNSKVDLPIFNYTKKKMINQILSLVLLELKSLLNSTKLILYLIIIKSMFIICFLTIIFFLKIWEM